MPCQGGEPGAGQELAQGQGAEQSGEADSKVEGRQGSPAGTGPKSQHQVACHGNKQCGQQQPGPYGQGGVTQPGPGGQPEGREIHTDEQQAVFLPFGIVAGEGDCGERQAGHDLEEAADKRPVDVQ
ncbi:MAG: hypothetical protein IPO99_06440 [Nitrospira sp.]|nr:hypothetical protein [Nitrospira sp.]